MEKTFAWIIAVAVSLILLLGLVIVLMAYSSDMQTEQSTKKAQSEQSTRDSQTEQPQKLETLTVYDVKGIVVETAMSLYQDGLMPEPREIHAEEACKLWDAHGTSRSSGYWGDKMSEAEDMNMSNALPVLVVMRTLVELNERYVTAKPAIAGYCNNVLRTQSKSEEREYKAPPSKPSNESNILRLLERKAIFSSE